MKTGDAKPWVYRPVIWGQDRQAAENHNAMLCFFGLASRSQAFLSEPYGAPLGYKQRSDNERIDGKEADLVKNKNKYRMIEGTLKDDYRIIEG